MITLLSACAASGPVVLVGGLVDGTPTELRVEDGRFTAVGPTVDREGARVVEIAGQHVVPAFVDAHVHLAYLPQTDAMLDGGIAAVVDWAAPLNRMSSPDRDLQHLPSGPMLTAPGGYPTTSWGRDGYGLETPPEDVEAAVGRLVDAGARVIKVPLQSPPWYDGPTLARIVAAASARGREVGVHALTADATRAACDAGAQILVHTPVEALPAETIAACARTTVITTLTAFGRGEATLANLRALREAGATVVYGTDFGNTRTAGIQEAELQAMRDAGMDGAAILAAGTSVSAGRFGFELGIASGMPASFLVLDADPRVDPSVLARPRRVWIAGEAR